MIDHHHLYDATIDSYLVGDDIHRGECGMFALWMVVRSSGTSVVGSLPDYHEDWDRCSGETVKAGAGTDYGYASYYRRATGVFLSNANDEHGSETYSEWGSR